MHEKTYERAVNVLTVRPSQGIRLHNTHCVQIAVVSAPAGRGANRSTAVNVHRMMKAKKKRQRERTSHVVESRSADKIIGTIVILGAGV